MKRLLPSLLVLALANLFPAFAFAAERDLFSEPALDRAPLSRSASGYLDQIKARKTTAEVRVVKMTLPVLADTRDPVNFNIFPGKDLAVQFESAETRSAKDYTWRGTVVGEQSGNATLVVNNGKVSGMIRSGVDIYAIEPLGDGNHALIKIDPAKFPPDHPPESGKAPGPSTENRPPTSMVVNPATISPAAINPAIIGSLLRKTEIKVLVAYTPKAKAAHADMNGLITLAVDEANQSYNNSRIPISLTLVHKYQTKYTESGSFDIDLAKFRTKADGTMDEVHTKRTTYKADVAVLIIDNPSYCGLASGIMANTNTAFAAVHYDCATGYYSFAHEIGHLQGARHDPAADPSSGPVCVNYNHGYLNMPKSWRTIMAYNNASCAGGSCTRIQYWSNPAVKFGGDPTGVAGANNNALCLNTTRATVAAFK
jgi:hypothetical protein